MNAWENMTTRLCTFTCGQDCAYVYIHSRAYMITLMYAYLCLIMLMYAYLYWHSWAQSRLCVHMCVCMIAPTCGNDGAHKCIYVQAWLRLGVCIRQGKITLMCTFLHAHDRAYVCRHDWARTHTPRHAIALVYTHMHTYAWTNVCIYTSTHAIALRYAHIHTCTHTHSKTLA